MPPGPRAPVGDRSVGAAARKADDERRRPGNPGLDLGRRPSGDSVTTRRAGRGQAAADGESIPLEELEAEFGR
jgi:hypothetical protein